MINNPNWQRMIKMPDGNFKDHTLTVIRLNPDNPREVTLIFEEDVCELSKDIRDNIFHFVFVPTEIIQKLKRDEIE